jgi:hypothetical protein
MHAGIVVHPADVEAMVHTPSVTSPAETPAIAPSSAHSLAVKPNEP